MIKHGQASQPKLVTSECAEICDVRDTWVVGRHDSFYICVDCVEGAADGDDSADDVMP